MIEYTRLGNINIEDHANSRIFVVFMARNVSIRTQKDGVTKFIVLDMVDRDVVVEARLFGAKDEQIEMIKGGKVYNAAVDIKPYDRSPNGLSCIIYNIEESSIGAEHFVEWMEGMEESQKEIENALGEIINTTYGQIAYEIVIKNWAKMSKWTAAKGRHHEKLGGLLVHTAEVIRIADGIAHDLMDIHGDEFINRPLLLASAILHDIGKVRELKVDITSGDVEYSTSSALASHIMEALTEIDIQAKELGIGEQQYRINEINEEEPVKSREELTGEIEELKLLKHCVASHHGKLEWGSPIKPNTPEAFILHHADMISAEMDRYRKVYRELDPGEMEATWEMDGYKIMYKELNK